MSNPRGHTLVPRQRSPAASKPGPGATKIPASSDWRRRHRARRPAAPTNPNTRRQRATISPATLTKPPTYQFRPRRAGRSARAAHDTRRARSPSADEARASPGLTGRTKRRSPPRRSTASATESGSRAYLLAAMRSLRSRRHMGKWGGKGEEATGGREAFTQAGDGSGRRVCSSHRPDPRRALSPRPPAWTRPAGCRLSSRRPPRSRTTRRLRPEMARARATPYPDAQRRLERTRANGGIPVYRHKQWRFARHANRGSAGCARLR